MPGTVDGTRYPIGTLSDVDVHFMHYPDPETAANAWRRRVARVDYGHLAVRFRVPSDGRGDRLAKRFFELPYERAVALSAHETPWALRVPEWTWDRTFVQTRQAFDGVTWLRGGRLRPAPLARLVHRRRATSVAQG